MPGSLMRLLLFFWMVASSSYGRSNIQGTLQTYKLPKSERAYQYDLQWQFSKIGDQGEVDALFRLPSTSAPILSNQADIYEHKQSKLSGILKHLDLLWITKDEWHLGLAKNPSLTATLPLQYFSVKPRFKFVPWDTWAIYQRYYINSLRLQTHIGIGEGAEEYRKDSFYLHQSFSYKLASGVFSELHGSYNANNGNSQEMEWLSNSPLPSKGFRTNRFSISFFTDGTHPKARGFIAGVAYHYTSHKDLENGNQINFDPRTLSNPDNYYYEDSVGKNESEIKTYSLLFSYRILDRFVISFLHQTQTMRNSGKDGFATCSSVVDEICNGRSPSGSLLRRQNTWGLGGHYDENVYLSFNWEKVEYDKLYEHLNFDAQSNEKSHGLNFLSTSLQFKL